MNNLFWRSSLAPRLTTLASQGLRDRIAQPRGALLDLEGTGSPRFLCVRQTARGGTSP